ncbi:MAG: hypothetical protein CR968_00200 [Flavobacteriia bacterium]|nr:MAG: hypothetical protein CR968_00200 [Flavobacteriia bacterium]
MNKFLIKFLLLSLFILVQCKSVNHKVSITQRKVSQKVIIRTASDNKNSIIRIQFPNEIILKNNSLRKRDLLTINYIYNNIPSNRNLNLGLYTRKNGTLMRVRNNKKKIIPSKDSLNFVFYSRHFVDSTKSTQKQFKPYVEKMLGLDKDTLHIGTVSEFKQKHEELFEKLTKGDSISIQFLDGKKLGERITVPVKW